MNCVLLLKLILKNAFRHRLRSILTIVGVAVALLAFGLMRTVLDAWNAGSSAAAANRLVTRNAVSLAQPLPYPYKERIRRTSGADVVIAGNWFSGVYKDKKNFFANLAVESDGFFRLYPEIQVTPAERKAFVTDRKGAIIGRKLAERFHWRVGDTITLRGTLFPGDWPLTIRGIYTGGRPDTNESVLYFQWAYLNETMKQRSPSRAGQAGFFIIGIADPNRAAEVSKTIDALFVNSQAETLTETERAFQLGFLSMSKTILLAVKMCLHDHPHHPGRGGQHHDHVGPGTSGRIRGPQDPRLSRPAPRTHAPGRIPSPVPYRRRPGHGHAAAPGPGLRRQPGPILSRLSRLTPNHRLGIRLRAAGRRVRCHRAGLAGLIGTHCRGVPEDRLMPVPLAYSWRNLRTRWLTTLLHRRRHGPGGLRVHGHPHAGRGAAPDARDHWVPGQRHRPAQRLGYGNQKQHRTSHRLGHGHPAGDRL